MLSDSQKEVMRVLEDDENVFITGIAGSGKSYIIDLFRQKYKYDKNIVVTSTTGISALLIKGTTFYSYLGIGLGNASVDILYNKILSKRFYLKRWINLDVLIIDEISMLSPDLFDKLEELARLLRDNDYVFGGIQIVLTGDMLQLPPVKFKGFCFEAKSWDKTIKNVICLTENFRQNDLKFMRCLNQLRLGYINEENEKLLLSRQDIKLKNSNGIIPTKIFSLNMEVDDINARELEKLENDYYNYEMEVISNEKQFIIEKCKKNCNMVEDLFLCVGAQVMLLTNLDIDGGLVNGSRGVIVDFIDDIPKVRFLNNKEIIIDYHTIKVEDNDKVLCEISQIPLKVSYAVSVHKIQGQTLDFCEVDLKNIFDYGQMYVALSRVKNLEGLSIRNFDKDNIKVHPKAIEFYKSL